MGLNKQALINIMSYPDDISDREMDELIDLLREYPYFQLGHALRAKAQHDKQTPDAYECLSHAAIYAPDRSCLRRLFYNDLSIRRDAQPDRNTFDAPGVDTADNTEQPDSSTVPEPEPSAPEQYHPPLDEQDLSSIPDEQKMQSDEVYRELQENLEQLRKNKNRFSDEDEDAAKKKIADDNHPASEDGQSAELSAERPSPEEDENNPAGSSGDHEPPSLLISHLDESEEQPALDINQQKQNELIDRFINSKVDFTENIRSKSKTAPQEEEQDLLGSSVESSENLISENLADIMLRQGKTDKAIEIYKKLIWKYPQKKTYFAEKIDQIKAD